MTRFLMVVLALALGAGTASAQLRYTVPQNCPNGKCPAPAPVESARVQATATAGCSNGSCATASVGTVQFKGGLFSRIRERRERR